MASLNNIYINEFYRSYFNTNKKRLQRKLDKPLWGLRVQAPSARSGSGLGSGRCLPVFPKGSAPAAQRGIWHPSGLRPSVPRVVFADAQGAAAVVGAFRFIECAGLYKTFTTALRALEMHPPFGGWRHHLARWEACHLILSRLRLLANQVPLQPPLRGGTIKLRYAVSDL